MILKNYESKMLTILADQLSDTDIDILSGISYKSSDPSDYDSSYIFQILDSDHWQGYYFSPELVYAIEYCLENGYEWLRIA